METKKIKYDMDTVIRAFDLVVNTECLILKYWVDEEKIWQEEDSIFLVFLEKQRQKLVRQGSAWNEEELKMRFLSFLFEMVDFDVENELRLFFERPLEAEINGYSLSVICDSLLAKPYGIHSPDKPYFFLQEFKRQKNTEDAEAQMLVAMLIAQQINENNIPVYGAFLQGKYWTFSVLYDKNYCVSRSFDATDKVELMQIIGILHKLKELILRSIYKI